MQTIVGTWLTVNIITYNLGGEVKQKWCGKWKCIHAHVFICSASLCLLVGALNPFTLKIITDIYDPIIIFIIVWGAFSLCRAFPFLFPAYRSSFTICYIAGLVVLNSLNFGCLESIWLHQIWRRVLLDRVFLVIDSSLSSL